MAIKTKKGNELPKNKDGRKREKMPLLPLPDTFLNRHPLLALLIRGVLVNLILETLCRHSLIGALGFVLRSPHLFLFNAVIIAATYSFMGLVQRRGFVEALVSVVWLGLGIADFILLFFRKTPLSFIDFVLIPSVRSIVFYYLNTAAIIGVGLLIAGLLAWIAVQLVKCRRFAQSLKHILCVPLYAAAVLLLTLGFQRFGIVPDHYENLINAYADNGFAYCFSRSLFDRGIAEPADYSSDSVEDILEAIVTPGKPKKNGFKPNIVMVQMECFFDPSHLTGITLDENPVPVFTRLMDTCPSGYLTVPVFGGGTVNTEFEVLTGMSVRDFGTGEYPYHTVLNDAPCESICYNLKEQGYTAHAIHNNTAIFYNRRGVFANLGFDTFTSIEYMSGVEYNPIGWAKDEILAPYIVTALMSTDTPDFIQTISVQAHGSYPDDVASEPIAINSDGFPDEDSKKEFAYYVSQLSETDAFAGDLIEMLKWFEEPTIVVFYGDHLPNFTIEDEMLDNGNIFQTQYAIWSNFELNAQDRDLNAWQLSAYVMELAGFDNGILTRLHQRYADNPNYAEALKLLEYDMLYGERSVYGGTLPFEPTDLRLGLRPIMIDDLRCGEKTMSVYGRNFTESSVVCVNGERRYTEFVSPSELIALSSTQAGDEVTVVQLSSGEQVGETQPFTAEEG